MAPIRVPATFDPIDDTIDDAWNTLRGRPLVDRIFYSASEAGNFSMVWHGLAVTRAVVLRDWRLAARTSAALGIESALVNGPIKSLFLRERPAKASELPHKLRQPKTSSFPSGHASAAVVASSFLTEGSGPVWRRSVRSLAAVVATSRVHVRIHHATDVAAGAAVGWVLVRAIRPVVGRLFD